MYRHGMLYNNHLRNQAADVNCAMLADVNRARHQAALAKMHRIHPWLAKEKRVANEIIGQELIAILIVNSLNAKSVHKTR